MQIFRAHTLRLGLLAVGPLLAVAAPSHGAFVLNLVESGNNIFATGSGTLNTTGLIYEGASISHLTTLEADVAEAIINPGNANFLFYGGISGPSSYGTAPGFLKSLIDSGDTVGIQGAPANLFVPDGYVSGAPLSDSATFQNVNFVSLHFTPGTYVWTWGSGATADKFTLNIGPVPEPASLALLGIGTGGLLLRRRRSSTARSI